MLRILKQQSDRRLFDDAAGVHDGDAIGHLRDDSEVMGDEQESKAHPTLQVAEQVEDLCLDRDVERRRRLVSDHQ